MCHVQDLMRFARFHIGDGRTEDGTRLLEPGSMALMRTPQVSIPGETEHWDMGLSWWIIDVAGKRALGHGGGGGGTSSLLMLVPEERFAFVLLTNADLWMAMGVYRWALREYLGMG